jgi:hypothetical protein
MLPVLVSKKNCERDAGKRQKGKRCDVYIIHDKSAAYLPVMAGFRRASDEA